MELQNQGTCNGTAEPGIWRTRELQTGSGSICSSATDSSAPPLANRVNVSYVITSLYKMVATLIDCGSFSVRLSDGASPAECLGELPSSLA